MHYSYLDERPACHSKGKTSKGRRKCHQGTFSTFEGAEYVSNVAAAISGGIESPLQIILQVSREILSHVTKRYL